MVGPFGEPGRVAALSDARGYLDSWIQTLAVLLYVVSLSVVTLRSLRSSDGTTLAVWLWLAFMAAFYVYFNPHEALLYSSQVVFPLVMLGARAFVGISSPSRLSLGYATVALIALVNLAILF